MTSHPGRPVWTFTSLLLVSLLYSAQGIPRGATGTARSDMIAALSAERPHPSLGKEAEVFDQMVGTWDCAYSFHTDDGKVIQSTGELRFGWIIDGRAIQDIWIGYPKRPNEERSIGTTIRFFDARTKLWRVVFVAPAFGAITQMQGGMEDGRIVLRGDDSDGSLLRWSFNDIKTDSFVWRGEKSRDRGKTWILEEEHRMTRRVQK